MRQEPRSSVARGSYFLSLIKRDALEHVAQKWAPVLRFADMRNQRFREGRVNVNERDTL